MNKDRLYSTHPERALQTAYRVLSSLQEYPADLQVAAVSVLFREVADNTGMSVSDLVAYASKVSRDADVYYKSTARALREYVAKELR